MLHLGTVSPRVVPQFHFKQGQRTGQPLEKVAEDTDRDYWMSAEESLEYGLVGKIIASAEEIA